MPELNIKQKLFLNLLVNQIGKPYHEQKTHAECYTIAGYKCEGAVARRGASQLLTNIDFQKEFKARVERVEAIQELSLEELFSVSRSLLTFDPADLVDKHNNPRPLRDVPKATRLALKGLEITQTVDPLGNVVTKYKYKSGSKDATIDREYRRRGEYGEEDTSKGLLAVIHADFNPSRHPKQLDGVTIGDADDDSPAPSDQDI